MSGRQFKRKFPSTGFKKRYPSSKRRFTGRAGAYKARGTLRAGVAGDIRRDQVIGTYFPKTLFCKLKWTLNANLKDAAKYYAVGAVRGNGPGHPSLVASFNQQPIGWKELMLIYSRYVCMGSKIRCTISNNDTDNHIIATLRPSNKSGIDVSDQYQSLPGSIVNVIPPRGGNNQITLKQYRSTGKLYGRGPGAEENFAAFTNPVDPNAQVPVNQWYWYVVVINNNLAAGVDAFVVFQMTYYVKFFATTESALTQDSGAPPDDPITWPTDHDDDLTVYEIGNPSAT
jgi:hypothetical protein